MAKKPMKKRPPPPPPSFSSLSDEEAPSPSIFAVKKLSASPSLKPADGEQEEEEKEEESSEDSEYAAPKRSHQAAPRVSRNTANDLKLEKPSAANKTARTVSMAEDDESSESEEEEESTDEESSEDSKNAVREPNPQTQRRDSQTANDGKHELSTTSSSSDSGAEDGEEDSKELNSRSKSEQLLAPPQPKPARNAVNPIADTLLKIPNSAKSVDGGEVDKGLESEEEEEESTADESSEGVGNTVAKENTGPQPRDSQNLDDDKLASDTPFSSGSGLGDDEEDIETPISDALLVPLSCKPIDSSVQPAEKEPNSRKQSAASPTQISKKKRTADTVGVVGGQEKEHFKRIWSNEDELALLQGIMDYKEQHHIIPYTHMHAESLLKSVKDSLSISVSVNQINDKVRRLKRRYINTSIRQNLAKKSKFSDPHNADVFDLSKKIWDSLKEESILLEKKIMLEKKENFNKKKVGLKPIEKEYPSLYWHLKSEHANNALLLQNHLPIANAKKWEETCKKLEMIDVELNVQKIEFLSSAVKLIKEALAKC
ncbi:hypothetical protein IEQ34_013765 [Dendrobium chrysotoxum]|uniref:Glabrous enhancer-binding protein-like DBD domain-containing protein n=1 Tax=Dendrobium chrysotoxum TaxID=161865 RepID=A0AAV7GT72_DENCH|nr:hypothetical protein IEQ34_013765 [Dendrobium chrysotoxum]